MKQVLIYGLVAVFFAVVLGFQIWTLRTASRVQTQQPLPARILRWVNLSLTLAALGIVIYGIVAR
ncbi:MAG: hypothetical protein WBI63_03645 [Coriobacteriia bacterium]